MALPVRLDPYQNIVNVHWNADKFLAFRLAIERNAVIPDYFYVSNPMAWDWDFAPTEAAGPPEGDETTYWPMWLSGFRYKWSGDAPPADGFFWRGDAWHGPAGISDVVGVPSLPIEHTFGAWEYAAEVVSGPPARSLWPRAEYVALSGSVTDEGLTVPGHVDLPFKLTSSATLQMRGQAFAGDSPYGREATNNAQIDAGSSSVQAESKVLVDLAVHGATFAPLAIDLSAITVIGRGRPWRAIGAALEPPASLSEPINPGFCWILCEPDSASS